MIPDRAQMIHSDRLHVILVHFNPHRLRVRTRLFLETVERLERQGAVVWRVEAAFGHRQFEVTEPCHPRHVRIRTHEELWNKEALVNLGARRIFCVESDPLYIAWVDADLEFVRHDWVSATIHQLQHHPVVQLFSSSIDLNPHCDIMGRAHGFAKLYMEGQRPGDFENRKTKYPTHMHPGYGWAWRREAWDGVGGMIKTAILGSGDHHMACALVGYARQSIWPGLSEGYAEPVIEWGEHADNCVGRDIGYVEGLVLHHFHGYKEHRGYKTRVDILREFQFDPETDLYFDDLGMPHLTGNKPGLRDAIRTYMGSRKEYDLSRALDSINPPIKAKKRGWLVNFLHWIGIFTRKTIMKA